MTKPPQSIPATFLIPTVSDQPVEITFRHDALRMAAVDKEQLAGLDDSWDVCGVYVLFGPGSNPNTFSAYVGKAPTGVRTRVRNHAKRKEGWLRAVLVARDAKYGFTSADVGWLEGRIYQLLDDASGVEILNEVIPRDESLTAWDREALDRLLTPIAGVLRTLGYRLESNIDEAEPARAESAGRVRTTARRDWGDLHGILTKVPEGRWTTYGDLARVIGSHPRAVGTHLQTCGRCTNAHRVLNAQGQVAPGFAWTDPDDQRDPQQLLRDEGVPVNEEGQADVDRRLTAEELVVRRHGVTTRPRVRARTACPSSVTP